MTSDSSKSLMDGMRGALFISFFNLLIMVAVRGGYRQGPDLDADYHHEEICQ